MESKALDELLEKNFSNVNSWLNFAEAKNAANIAFVVTCISAIFSLNDMNVLLYILCLFLIISGMCSLISFVPKLENKAAHKFQSNLKNRKVKEDNLIFFEDIKKYSGDDYLKQVFELYFNENKYNPTKYQLDLSDEITYNAYIVSWKYKFFKVAVCLDIVIFLMLAFFIVLA